VADSVTAILSPPPSHFPAGQPFRYVELGKKQVRVRGGERGGRGTALSLSRGDFTGPLSPVKRNLDAIMGLVILRRLFRHLLSEWQLGCRDSTREREQRTLTEVEAAKKKKEFGEKKRRRKEKWSQPRRASGESECQRVTH